MTDLSVQLNDGRVLPVSLRHHGRTRRLTARLDPRDDAVRVTAPPRTRPADIQAFLDEHKDWVAAQLDKRGTRIALNPDTLLPIEGQDRRIIATGARRGLPVLTDGTLEVPGDPEHVPRRVLEFCKKRARSTILPLAEIKAASILTRVKRVTVRDTTSRWGSCTNDGCLSFSWRLILAPPPVLDYVVAHEVAHLRHMDHSDKFWALNAQLTLAEMSEQRAWLRRHGSTLFRYG
jgi:Predicted metal-dependent hydrolase